MIFSALFSAIPAFAQAVVSSSKYIISSKSCGQPSAFSLFNILHATTCTAGMVLHILSFKQRQWFGFTFSGFSICSLQVSQIKIAVSEMSLGEFGTSKIARFSSLPQSSHLLLLRFCNSFSEFIFYNLGKGSIFL